MPLTTRLRPGPRVVFPFPTGARETVASMSSLLAAGKYDPMIDRRYSLVDAVRAYEYVLAGQKLGNVVLDVV